MTCRTRPELFLFCTDLVVDDGAVPVRQRGVGPTRACSIGALIIGIGFGAS